MDFLAFLLAIGVGFGTACFIFASLLSKSNDIGNSIGTFSHYSSGVEFDRRADRLKDSEKASFGIGYFRKEDMPYIEPGSMNKVEVGVMPKPKAPTGAARTSGSTEI